MLPKFIKNCLWFSDTSKMNLKEDYRRIILNVLNIGSKEATDWLLKQYPKEVIKKVITERGALGELNKKSLNYWTLMFKIDKKDLIKSRF